MKLEKILEMITFEVVAEGIAAIFGIGAMWYIFFGGGLQVLMEYFGIGLCG